MDNMVLVLDESGAKGYAKTKEKTDGELGVMAGFLYTQQEINEIEYMLNKIIEPFKKCVEGKFHITELRQKDQDELRKRIFFAFRETRLQWFFNAVYVQGFHQSEFKDGRGGTKDSKASLHVELFGKMFIYSLVLAASINKKKLNLLIKTDNIDDGILKKFQHEGKYLIDLIMGNERELFTHVKNEDSGQYTKKITFVSTLCDAFPKFETIEFEIECEVSPLTIAADILANSVNYYLRNQQKENMGVYLNNRKSIIDHPLADLAFIPQDEKHVLPLLDIIYRRE